MQLRLYQKNKENKERSLNNYDIYKNIAFFVMVLDHIGYFFLQQFLFIRLIGRASAVIFAILHGFSCKRKNNKILFFALLTFFIVQVSIEKSYFPPNILFHFYLYYFLADTFKYLYDNFYWFFISFILCIVPLFPIVRNFIEYGPLFIFVIFCGTIFKKEEKTLKDTITTIIIFFIHFINQIICFHFDTVKSVILFIYLTIIYLTFYNFKIKDVKSNNIILFIVSKYSLQLYFIHLLIFSTIYFHAYFR